MSSGSSIDKLHVHSKPVAVALYRAFEHVANVQLPPDLPDVQDALAPTLPSDDVGSREPSVVPQDPGPGQSGRNGRPRGRVGGLGLSGMRERALLVGGNLAIYSAPGEGTTIELTMGAAS